MKSSDIAYLRQIAAGLEAVEEINKNAVKTSLEKHLDAFQEILDDKENNGVGFKGLQAMEKNQVLKLAKTNMLIYKDSNNFYIPFEISNREKITIVPRMYTDENFANAISYAAKTKNELQEPIKNKIKNSPETKERMKIAELNMTKIFKMPTKEKNDALQLIGINDFQNILEHYEVKKSLNFRVTKRDYEDSWITDEITKRIKKDYDEVKKLLLSKSSAVEVYAQTKKLLKEIDGVYNNYSLDDMIEKDANISSFFNVGSTEILILKENVSVQNYNPSYHNITISKQDAIAVVKEKGLEEIYPIEKNTSIKLFQAADTIEDLKFGLIEYLSYQAEMKNDYKMMKQAEYNEKQKNEAKGYGYDISK